jgi:hypothetical protein
MRKNKRIITEAERKQNLEETQKRIIESFDKGMEMLGEELPKQLNEEYWVGNIKKDQLSKIQSPERKIKNIDIGNTNPRLNEEDIKVGDKVDIKPGVISTPYTHGNDEYIYDVSVVQINGDKLTVMDMNGDEYSVQITDVE